LDSLRISYLLKEDEEDKETVAQLQAAKEALEALPKIGDIDAEKASLNEQLIKITECIIAAASVENCQEELMKQIIIAFKANPTPKRWDDVRQLIPEEEWTTVKEELVVYVLKQNTNIQDKIELLIKDGMYKQVIEVFPSPDGSEGELDLLLKVYRTIEEKYPVLLEKLIPVVSRYMKRYFQEQNYDKMYPILDRFQRRFPTVVVTMIGHATDMVMFNILPSQYKSFLIMLKNMKMRLESINRQNDWHEFFNNFKRKHIGKKKLIQMVSLIGDSVWNMDVSERPKKKLKLEKSPKVKEIEKPSIIQEEDGIEPSAEPTGKKSPQSVPRKKPAPSGKRKRKRVGSKL